MNIWKELKDIKVEYTDRYEKRKKAGLWSMFKDIIIGLIRILRAKYYLRNCKTGTHVSIKGIPKIGALGKIEIGNWVRIWSDVNKAQLYTIPGSEIIIGDNSRINGVHISAQESITIGKNVRIAPNTIIIDSDFHSISDHFAPGKSAPIIIEDDVWIAMGCIILKGVHIGKGSVVAAGSVVTKNIPPDSVYGGVPAKFIKKIK